jgi:CheY-like chemotaxis protein
MPKSSTLKLVEAIADVAAHTGRASEDVRAQVAFIRALVDEVESFHPAERWIPSLHEQLGDEVAQLAQLVKHGSTGAALDAEPEPAKPIDVLVVDDDEDGQRAALAVLRDLGYPCRAVGDADAALKELARQPAAIVLTDWSMPGMSGVELCAALKSHEPQPYVILLTAFGEEAREKAVGPGRADDFLKKPVDLDELEKRLRGASRLIRAYRTVAALNERLRDGAQAS